MDPKITLQVDEIEILHVQTKRRLSTLFRQKADRIIEHRKLQLVSELSTGNGK